MSRTITSQDLSSANGKNGNPAYIAYKGKVFDVSTIFVDGEHQGCLAGKDLTNTLQQSPHDESLFANFTPIGDLQG